MEKIRAKARRQTDTAGSRLNEVNRMGLFDVFSKGGKYFGKAIEPKCEYCEHGNRSKEGNKVLCPKKGMVDAGYHCPKFLYSPLKRIPVKQLERVGWLEGDYEEKDFEQIKRQKEEDEKKAAEEAKKAMDAEIAKKAAEVVKEQAKAVSKPNPVPPAPAPAAKPETAPPVTTAPAQAPAAPQTSVRTPDAAPAATRPTTPVPPDELASLAAMAETAGQYVPESAEAKPEEPANDMSTLSSI